jgi:hypothetical protein
VRLEFTGKDGQYLGDETVNVSATGTRSRSIAAAHGADEAASGAYKVSADVAEAGHRRGRAPGRVIVRFPNTGGGWNRQRSAVR